MKFTYYDLVIGLFVTVLLVSNISATKLIEIGPLIFDGGAVLFPVAYILGDIMTEVYGFRYTRRAIWIGFASLILASGVFWLVQLLPPAADYTNQASFEAVLGFLPRIVLASLSAYLVGEFINAVVLVRLKQKTQGRMLWLRLIGSTIIGQLFDTIIFCLIAFGGVISTNDMLTYILVGWVFKTLVEVVVLPVTYWLVARLKRLENVDSNDSNTKLTWLGWSLNDYSNDSKSRS